tara:strand:+ start:5220 stop:7820 length:2601 start_codon:yes stop_codon:yes gene_type:complete
MIRIRFFFSFLIILIILLVTCIFVTSFFYFNNNFYSKAIELSKNYPRLQKMIDFSDSFYNEIDFRKYLKETSLPETKVVRLYLTGSDLKNINEQIETFKNIGFIKDEINYWRKAKLKVNGIEEKIKYKFHGTSISPLSNHNSISLRIKHKKDGNYLNNMRRFSLLSYKDDLDISTISINKIASDFGLISPVGKMVILKINNIDIGMYMLVEHHSKEWFEKFHKMTNYSLFKSNDDWDRKENTGGTAHLSSSDNLVNNKEIKGSSLDHATNLAALKLLLDAVQKKDIYELKQLIDLDYAAKFLALNILFNNAHHVSGDNFKYLYDQTRGKFKFLFRIEDSVKPIEKSLESFNSSWFESYFVKSQTLDLFYLLTQDDEFRNLRDEYLMRLIEKKDLMIETAKKTFDENYDVLFSSKNSLRKANFFKSEFFENLINNFEAIEQYLNYGKVFLTFEKTKPSQNFYDVLSVFNDSYVNSTLKFQDKKDVILKEFQLMPLEIGETLASKNRISEFILEEQNVYSKFELENNITKQSFDEKDIYVNYLDSFSFTNYEDSLSTLKSNNINYSLTKKELIVLPGNYNIRTNLIFPENLKIIFSSGSNFFLDENISILVKSDIEIKGTEALPVTIESNNNEKSFGVLAIFGKEKIVNVLIDNLKINGGSEASLEGVRYLGQISIHNAKVKIFNSIIEGSSSDDGINIRDSKVLISNSVFKNNSADQIDLDFCSGEVNKSIFLISKDYKTKVDFNGDGLDLSGSEVKISENTFTGFLDKALSIGEESKALINKNSFGDNKSAITVKDGSRAFVLSNNFLNNEQDFTLFKKKRFYDSPTLFIKKSDLNKSFQNNLKNRVNSIKLSSEEEMRRLYATNR